MMGPVPGLHVCKSGRAGARAGDTRPSSSSPTSWLLSLQSVSSRAAPRKPAARSGLKYGHKVAPRHPWKGPLGLEGASQGLALSPGHIEP